MYKTEHALIYLLLKVVNNGINVSLPAYDEITIKA